jgi:hypothetical protein
VTDDPRDDGRRGLPGRGGSHRGVPDPRTVSRVIYWILAIFACVLLFVLVRAWIG